MFSLASFVGNVQELSITTDFVGLMSGEQRGRTASISSSLVVCDHWLFDKANKKRLEVSSSLRGMVR